MRPTDHSGLHFGVIGPFLQRLAILEVPTASQSV